MSSIILAGRRPGGDEGRHGVSGALAGLGRHLLEAVIRSWRRHATRRALARLDSRELKDIGLYRGDITWVAEQVAQGIDPRPNLRAPRERPEPSHETVPAGLEHTTPAGA